MIDSDLMKDVLAGNFSISADDIAEGNIVAKPGVVAYGFFEDEVPQVVSAEEARSEGLEPVTLPDLIAMFNTAIIKLAEFLGTLEHWRPESHWDEHEVHHVEDWMYEVANRDTRQSYIEWVNSKIAEEKE